MCYDVGEQPIEQRGPSSVQTNIAIADLGASWKSPGNCGDIHKEKWHGAPSL